MTGYGRAHLEVQSCAVTVEIRSVNHRYLKVTARVPDVWERLEQEMEALVKGRISRGAVTVALHKLGTFAGTREVVVNRTAIEEYRRQLAQVEGGDKVTVAQILLLPGAVGAAEESDAELEEVWKNVLPVVERALDQMVEMRRREGEHLRDVLLATVARLRGLMDEVRRRAPDMVKDYRDRLTGRLNELLSDSQTGIDREDLARELAIFAERSDIREEIDRMDSHLKQFAALLGSDAAAGRQLEFLVQEMFRETSTMGAKAADAELAAIVLDAKAEVDRLKEQVMNVE
jgi:uncharacterized protein (TIGR00255 family)